MLLNKLFKKIKSCYGATHSKLVPITLVDENGHVDKTMYSNDGVTILKAFARENISDPDLQCMLKMVKSFEEKYGDATSFLCMLTLTLISRDAVISEDEVNEVLDSLPVLESSEEHKKRWIKTVARYSDYSDNLADLFMENRIHSYSAKDNLENTFTVDTKNGISIPCKVFPYFTSPKYKNLRDQSVFFERGDVSVETYKKYVDIAIEHQSMIIVFCKWYSTEVEDAMAQHRSCPVLLFKIPDASGISFIDDLMVLCQADVASEEEELYTGKIGRICVFNDKINLEGFSAKKEDVEEYCKRLYDQTRQSTNELRAVKARIQGLMDQKVSSLIISSKTPSERDDIAGVVNDIIMSWDTTMSGGFTEGTLRWADKNSTAFKSTLGRAIISVKEHLASNSNPNAFSTETVDGYSQIRNAIIEATTYANKYQDVLRDDRIVVDTLNFYR